MKNKKTLQRVILIGILLIGLSFIPVKTMGIYQFHGKLLWAKRMDEGDTFTFSYIHSVSKTPIQEMLAIGADKEFLVKEVHYIDQGGAGMPEYTWDEEEFESEDGEFILKNFSRTFSEINLTIQKKYDDLLTFDTDSVDLDQLIGGNGNVQLKIRHTPLWKYEIIRVTNKFGKAR